MQYSPVLIFVDGACEEAVSIGGVLFDADGTRECFGATIGEETIDSWKSRGDQTQVIGQAELFPLLVARLTWQARLENRKVIYFQDNESARIAMIRAYSPVLSSLNIIVKCITFDFEHASSPWYARVPTVANVSDGPSRMDVSEAVNTFGASVVRPVFPAGVLPAEVAM